MKFVIFLVLLTILAAAVYSSSPALAAKDSGIKVSCTGTSSTTQSCIAYDTKYGDTTKWNCTTKDGGKTWSCVQAKEGLEVITPALGEALDKAIGESRNTTKVPKSDFLNDGGLLKGQGDNQTTSKTIVPTQDRFCLEGTGGNTGKACIHCDPGLTFEVGCVDVTTGGPLDMPDAATSESEEDDDTNPKDLGGLNDDENGPNVNPGSD